MKYFVLDFSVLVIGRYENFISLFYQYRPIRKLSLSGFIGIGRYEKKLIGCTLIVLDKDVQVFFTVG